MTDARPEGIERTYARGQQWWLSVRRAGADFTEAGGLTIEANLLRSWSDRRPQGDPDDPAREVITIRRPDPTATPAQPADTFWIGQPAGVARDGGVFYLAISRTAGSPPVDDLGVEITIGASGVRQR